MWCIWLTKQIVVTILTYFYCGGHYIWTACYHRLNPKWCKYICNGYSFKHDEQYFPDILAGDITCFSPVFALGLGQRTQYLSDAEDGTGATGTWNVAARPNTRADAVCLICLYNLYIFTIAYIYIILYRRIFQNISWMSIERIGKRQFSSTKLASWRLS